MQTDNDPYQDIRPYNDSEVSGAIQRLANDQEFLSAILHYRFPKLSPTFCRLLFPLAKRFLLFKWAKITSVESVQTLVADYMRKSLAESSEGVTYSGLNQLDPNKAYLFVSNHRDIAMDPALVNWCLHKHNFQTVRIAIGDNLLTKPCATELMRLNKSFIVKRSIKAPRELLKSLTLLSSYISHSLETGHSIWIAQREGRAKDGNDMTEPAILKMFYMEGRKRKESFGEFTSKLHIVPVSISYENDPCDAMKAKELYLKQTEGHYQKGEFEDIESIVSGITGKKRHIHVSFGHVIDQAFETPELLATEIDRQIHQNYKLYPINYLAADQEHESITDEEQMAFDEKLASVAIGKADLIKRMYANPVLNKIR